MSGNSFEGKEVTDVIKKFFSGDFINFRYMLGTALFKYVYLIGAIVVTVFGVVMIFQGGFNTLIGLGLITLGNLLWRVCCETWFLFISIHDILASIEKNQARDEEEPNVQDRQQEDVQ